MSLPERIDAVADPGAVNQLPDLAFMATPEAYANNEVTIARRKQLLGSLPVAMSEAQVDSLGQTIYRAAHSLSGHDSNHAHRSGHHAELRFLRWLGNTPRKDDDTLKSVRKVLLHDRGLLGKLAATSLLVRNSFDY